MAFTDEQRKNAKIIAEVGRQLGASERDVQIAIMTAIVESNLVNVNYGDRDSIGLFQQRSAWSAAANRMDPHASAKMFFLGGEQGQRGLFDFKNRDQMGMGQAAQAVQVSAFPDRYAQQESAAASLLGGIGGDSGAPSTPAPRPTFGPGEQDPQGGTVTVNPTVDNTAAALGAAQRASAGVAPELESGIPGLGATTGAGAVETPGLGATAATGTGADTGAGAPPEIATDYAVTEPDPVPKTYTAREFAEMFPDAASSRMFSDPGGTNGMQSSLITAARSFLGVPFVWGGTGSNGVDCSGLVQQVYHQMGIEVPHLSSAQMAGGVRTAYEDLRPGDLIGWQMGERNGSGVEHISIYIGNDMIIEAPRTGLNVRQRKLSASEIASGEGVHYRQLD